MTWRSSLEPWNFMPVSDGHQRLISFIQLAMVDLGTSTRYGPSFCSNSYMYPKMDMDCSVFPRPISSARMPLMPFSWLRMSQLRPSSW